jgi:hypothetical protein
MDRIAFIVPVHPPFFHHLRNFLTSIPSDTSRVYVVFSSPEDRDAFGSHPAVSPIVIPQGLTYAATSGAGIVDFKKFYALSQLITAPHDYFIVCDSESAVIPQNFTHENVKRKIDDIFNHKRIYCGHLNTGDGGNTTASCAAFPPEQRETLRRLTRDYRYQFWWSDLPVYKRDHLPHFFEVLPIPKEIVSRPDYTIYQCYLALYHGFTFVNVTPHIGIQSSLEGFVTNNQSYIHRMTRLGYGHAWVVNTQYTINQALLNDLGTFLYYHIDRWTTPDCWGAP